MTKPTNSFKRVGHLPAFAKILGTGALLSLPLTSHALQFEFSDPNTQAFIDTSVSLGAIFRGVEGYSPASPANPYQDNNFPDKGELVSTPLKITVEAGIQKGSMGAFIRGTYIYDAIIMGLDPSTGLMPANDWITADGQDEIGNSFRLLDAFVFGSVGVGGTTTLSGRVGNQVLSWGESTFISNSLNSINPADGTKARGAAPELKEIMLPLPMISGSLDFGGAFSIDAYYVAKWEASIVDPVGTFFSPTSALGEGFEELSVVQVSGYTGSTIDAEDGGEYGIAFRSVSESLGWMEFGLYYMRQTSHVPYFQATMDATATLSYQLIYPEDIDVFGASFNVDLPGELGVSMAGEISYRPDVPLSYGSTTLTIVTGPGVYIGYSEGDMTQAQVTFTYTTGSANPFGADKMSILFEPGLVYAQMPENTKTEQDVFGELDRFSYGYVALVKLEYSDVFWNLTLEPAITYKQDIKGSGPGISSATFVERRKSMTAGVTATYLTSTTFDIGYTAYWGGGAYESTSSQNYQRDLDFLALTVKTSF